MKLSEIVDEIIAEEELQIEVVSDEKESGMDDSGNTWIYELIGFPIVGRNGLVRKRKGAKINMSTVSSANYSFQKEEAAQPPYIITIIMDEETSIVLEGNLALVVYKNRTAIRLAGYKVFVR